VAFASQRGLGFWAPLTAGTFCPGSDTGNAWHYAAYSKDQSLADLQSQAQAQKLGLWAQPNPTPPGEFRKAKK